MPHPEILRVLGMTAREWGALPPEQGPDKSKERAELRTKAYGLLAAEKKQEKDSIHARLDAMELRVQSGFAEALTPLASRLDGIEERLRRLETPPTV